MYVSCILIILLGFAWYRPQVDQFPSSSPVSKPCLQQCSNSSMTLASSLFFYNCSVYLSISLPCARGTHKYKVRVYSNLAYGPITQTTDSNQLLDLYVPDGAKGTRPCIIFIHGGGWSSGNKNQFAQMAQNYASLGYITVSLNYRLTINQPTAGPWPIQIGDVQLAVRWLRNNADTYNINPNELITYGSSAGSHLALYLAIDPTIHPSDMAKFYPTVSPQVEAVVDQFGPTDLVRMYNESNSEGFNATIDLMGGTTSDNNYVGYKDGSPYYQISNRIGPTYITQGTQDTTVPPDQSQELQSALQANGTNVTYVPYDGGHDYSGLTPAQVAAIEQGIENWIQTLYPVS